MLTAAPPYAWLMPALPRATSMKPTLIAQPFRRPGWVYEEKVDGWRVLAYKDGDRVRRVSRQGKDRMRRSNGLVAAVGALEAHTLVLDGKVAVFDPMLRSRFEWLRGAPEDRDRDPADA